MELSWDAPRKRKILLNFPAVLNSLILGWFHSKLRNLYYSISSLGRDI